MMGIGSHNYPGEPYLSEALPNYGTERILLVIQLVIAFVFWVVLVPLWTSQEVVVDANLQSTDRDASSPSTSTANATAASTSTIDNKTTASKSKNGKSKKGKDSKSKSSAKKEKEESAKEQDQRSAAATSATQLPPKPETIREMNPLIGAGCTVAFMCTFVWIMVKAAPDNRYTARGVFEAPLFSREECDFLVDMAERVADRNRKAAEAEAAVLGMPALNDTLEGFLKEPLGWQKRRHNSYPTTDLNVMTDPFTKNDRAWIRQKLDARLAPTISRLFGVPQGAIRADDVSHKSTVYIVGDGR
jgi:hypothetical protein